MHQYSIWSEGAKRQDINFVTHRCFGRKHVFAPGAEDALAANHDNAVEPHELSCRSNRMFELVASHLVQARSRFTRSLILRCSAPSRTPANGVRLRISTSYAESPVSTLSIVTTLWSSIRRFQSRIMVVA